MKPMLARDWVETKVKFPCIIQPKIDGVRGLNIDGKLVARSLKPHDNPHVTELFSGELTKGFDGEIIIGNDPTAKDLCRLTSGAMRRYHGAEDYSWYVFDVVIPGVKYSERYARLVDYLKFHHSRCALLNVMWIPSFVCKNMQQLLETDQYFLDQGFEGSIIRNPDALYKEGRSDSKMQCWRIKRFIDCEFIIEELIEGQHNANEATTNELGRTTRSTHQENMMPNGTLGAFRGTILKDVEHDGEIILSKGDWVTVSPGNLSHDERKHAWDNPKDYVKKIGKMKFFPKGMKDKPRFPTFISLRDEKDM